jgi:hypothetical protein
MAFIPKVLGEHIHFSMRESKGISGVPKSA